MGRLEDRIDYNREQRKRITDREQPHAERLKEIREAFNVTQLDFYCKACAKDFTTTAYKHVRETNYWPIAYYVGLCPKRHRCLRYITEKYKDPYYWTSKLLQRQRVDLADAMLTPDHPRFKLVYPEQYKKIMEETKNDY